MPGKQRSNIDVMLEGLNARVTSFADFRTGPSYDHEEMAQKVLITFMAEAKAGALKCLGFAPIEAITPNILMPHFEQPCFQHCCQKVNNQVRAAVRRSQRRNTASIPSSTIQNYFSSGRSPPVNSPLTQACDNEMYRLLWTHIDKLNEEDREAIIIFHFFGKTYEAGAAILELTRDAFRYRVRRAHQELKESLRPVVEGKIRSPLS